MAYDFRQRPQGVNGLLGIGAENVERLFGQIYAVFDNCRGTRSHLIVDTSDILADNTEEDSVQADAESNRTVVVAKPAGQLNPKKRREKI